MEDRKLERLNTRLGERWSAWWNKGQPAEFDFDPKLPALEPLTARLRLLYPAILADLESDYREFGDAQFAGADQETLIAGQTTIDVGCRDRTFAAIVLNTATNAGDALPVLLTAARYVDSKDWRMGLDQLDILFWAYGIP